MKFLIACFLFGLSLCTSAQADEPPKVESEQPFQTLTGGPGPPPREVIDAQTLDELLDRLEMRSGVSNLKAALFWEFESDWGTELSQIDQEMFDRKVEALNLLCEHGNRLALPVIEKNLALPKEFQLTIAPPCRALLFHADDIRSTDIRQLLTKLIMQDGVIRDEWPPARLANIGGLLEKDFDVRNVPLIVKVIKACGIEHSRQSYLPSLRNVIYIETNPNWSYLGRHPKSKFFPYTFDNFHKLSMEEIDHVLEIYEANKHRMPPFIARERIDAKNLDELLVAIEARTKLRNVKETLFASLPDPRDEPRKYDCMGRAKQAALEALYKYGNRNALPLIKHNLALAADDAYQIDNWCMFMLIVFDDVTAQDIRDTLAPFIQARRMYRNGRMTDFAAHLHWTLGKHYDIRSLPLIVEALGFEQSSDSKKWLLHELRDVIFFAYAPGPRIFNFDAKSKPDFFPYDYKAFENLGTQDLAKVLEIYDRNKDAIVAKNEDTIISEEDKRRAERAWDLILKGQKSSGYWSNSYIENR